MTTKTSAVPPTTVLYDNGPFATGSVSTNGTPAPSGAQWSEIQNVTLGITSFGYTVSSASSNRIVDDFTVPAGTQWVLNSATVYGYITGSPTSPSPFTSGSLQIWSGDPTAGGTIIAGDTTTNVLTSSTSTNVYRATENGLNTARLIWANTLTPSSPVVLGPGTYWIDYTLSGGFAPPVTILGLAGKPGGNSYQWNAGWAQPTQGSVPTRQDFPFLINGFVPTAANAALSGRVTDAAGSPLAGVTVVLTDSSGNRRSARSNTFGNFRFDSVPAGQIYLLDGSSKRFVFATQVLNVTDDATDIVLVGN